MVSLNFRAGRSPGLVSKTVVRTPEKYNTVLLCEAKWELIWCFAFCATDTESMSVQPSKNFKSFSKEFLPKGTCTRLYKPLITITVGDKSALKNEQLWKMRPFICLALQKKSRNHTEITLPPQRRPHRIGWGLPPKLIPSTMLWLEWTVKKEILLLCFPYLTLWKIILFNSYSCNNSGLGG